MPLPAIHLLQLFAGYRNHTVNLNVPGRRYDGGDHITLAAPGVAPSRGPTDDGRTKNEHLLSSVFAYELARVEV